MSELQALARFASEFRLERASSEVVTAAKYCVLDSVGAALGAVSYEEIPNICREFRKWCRSDSMYQASVWGQGFKMDAFQALLLNGIMGHALELDDVHTGSKSHIGAVVVETAWTFAEAGNKTGKNFLEAVIVGYEIMSRVGMAMDVVSCRKHGWHGTGIIGTFGAAAAAGHLMGLSEETMLSAFGIAGTQSSGLWAFLEEGASCKKLHPARAAVNGLTAAVLAEAGMTGPRHILEARDGGLYRAVSEKFDMAVLAEGIGKEFEILRIDKKPYPCCRTTHHAIDAALKLRRYVQPEEISQIVLETYEVGVLQCGSPHYPKSSVEAKFSIPYTVAAAFIEGRVSLREFSEAVFQKQEMRELAAKVVVVADQLFCERYPKQWGCRMRIIKKDGCEITEQIDNMSGSQACPLTKGQETDKFRGLAEPAIGSNRAASLEGKILQIEQLEKIPSI